MGKVASSRLLLSLAGCLAVGCSAPRHGARQELLKLSDKENICTTAQASLRSKDPGIDFVFGVIETASGETVHYYVGSEPGQLGEGRLIHSAPTSLVAVAGREVVENTYADGIRSFQVNGFSNHIDGRPNVSVQYFFFLSSAGQIELAKKLASATFACQRPNNSFKPNPLRGSA